MDSSNVITADEMAAATDTDAPVTPAKFLPYRKLTAEVETLLDGLCDAASHLDRLGALFGSLMNRDDYELGDFARAGKDLAILYSNTASKVAEAGLEVFESAKATLPRKRWEGCAPFENEADADDLAREAAAAVPNDGEDGK